MGKLSELDANIEKFVDNALSKFSKNELKPVDFMSLLKNYADKHITNKSGKTFIPNIYIVSISPKQFDIMKEKKWFEKHLETQIGEKLEKYAESQGYLTEGEIAISFDGNKHPEFSLRQHEIESFYRTAGSNNIKPVPTAGAGQEAGIGAGSGFSGEGNLKDLVESSVYLLVGTEKFPITKDVTVIGRSKKSDIVIDDPSVSREHCYIKLDTDGTYFIEDNNSTNGVRVEGHIATQPIGLVNDNTIHIGKVSARFKQS
jgi:hypothetical protein